MIVEFFGLPGSGKSTFARKLADQAGFEIIKIRSKRELVYYNLQFLIKHPIRFILLFKFLLDNYHSRQVFYFKFMNTFLDYNAKYQKALKYDKAILDQGYFLNVLAVFETNLTGKEMKRYLKYILLPDLLIILDTNMATCLENANRRGYFAREDFSDAYQRKWRSAMKKNYELFKEVVASLDVKAKIIDGNKRSDEIDKEIQLLTNCQQ